MTSIVSAADERSFVLLALLIGALLVPVAGAIGLMVAGRHRVGDSTQRRLSTLVAGVATLCLLGLLAYPDTEVHLPVWLPSAGPMSLHLGGLGGQAAVATSAALLAALLLSSHDRQAPWPLLLAALSAANISFLAGDFLTRYAALEVLGLGIAVAPLAERLRSGMRKAKEIYLYLRVGDAGLLIAILILTQAGGTLVIEDALEAGTQLRGSPLSWVVGGMLTAVWVKTGAWPFHRWLAAAKDISPLTGTWLYGLVMPNLGLYLLYRVTPLLILDPVLGWLAFGLSGIGILILSAGLLSRGSWEQLPVYLNAAIGCAALGLATSGHQNQLAWLLLIATPLRLAAWIAIQGPAFRAEPAPGTVAHRSLEDWLLQWASYANRAIESRLLQQGVNALWRAVIGAARLFYGIGERSRIDLWRAIGNTSHVRNATDEGDASSLLIRATSKSALSISCWLQRGHTGRLRRNLQWVMLGFAAVMAFVVISKW